MGALRARASGDAGAPGAATRNRRRGHVVELGTPGSGVYDVAQPDYLLLNNPCGQLTLYPFETESHQPCYGLSLYDWATAAGYRWVGDQCAVDPAGEPIEPHHFLPRRLMGEYLRWFYRALLASAPPNVHVVHHQTSAVDSVGRRHGCEEVRLANANAVVVDHVIVTTGHTPNQDVGGSRAIRPYPVTSNVEQIPSGTKVAVSGMGLVAVDVVTALTVGRGGEFVAERRVDVRRELLHLLFAEMYARYYSQMAFQAEGSRAAGAAVRERLRAAWLEDRFRDELARVSSFFGSFDAEALFFGNQPSYHSRGDCERFVYQALADDLREAEVPDGRSPVKSAAWVFRRPAVHGRRRPRDPWPSRGAENRELGVAATGEPLQPWARQPVPLRRGRRG